MSRMVRTAVIATAVLAATLVAATAHAEEQTDTCINAPTGGLELRLPYLSPEAETQARSVYDEHGQPADMQYHYFAYVPQGLPDGPVPLVMTMHGLLGSAKQHLVQTRWQETADEHGFVLIAPNGHRAWDYTDGSVDNAWLRDVIADVRARNCLDERRMYATGHSMGGFMTQRVACDLGDLFAAGASYAAGDLTNGGPCTPGLDGDSAPLPGWERMPIGNWHGAADSVIGYGAGRRGIDKWLVRYDCDSTPVTTTDGFGAAETWSACLDDTTVHFRTLDGHGHAWPDGCGGHSSGTGGSLDCEPEPGTGPWPAATDLTEELWSFLSQFARDQPAVAQEVGDAPVPERMPSSDVVIAAVDEGVTTGIDSVATFRRAADLTADGGRLRTELVLRVEYTGDGAGVGASHPVCPTSNPGPGTQSQPDRTVTVGAVDRGGSVVSVDVVTEPFVADNGDHLERVTVEIPGDFDPTETVVRASHEGDVVKFWWGCGTPPARYKETIGDGACGMPSEGVRRGGNRPTNRGLSAAGRPCPQASSSGG